MIYTHILMGNGMLKNTFENSSYLWDYKDTHIHIYKSTCKKERIFHCVSCNRMIFVKCLKIKFQIFSRSFFRFLLILIRLQILITYPTRHIYIHKQYRNHSSTISHPLFFPVYLMRAQNFGREKGNYKTHMCCVFLESCNFCLLSLNTLQTPFNYCIKKSL